MEGNSGNLAKREHRGEASRTKNVTRRERERERVHRLHAPFLLRVDHRTKDRESMSRQLRETPMEEAGEAEGRREPRDRRKSFERKRKMGMKGDLENSGTPKSARERERERAEERMEKMERRREGEGEWCSERWWTARWWSEGEREGGKIKKKKGGPEEGRRTRKRKKKRSSCSRLSGSHI